MLCEECKDRQATVVITVVKENGTITKHLCSECMAKVKESFDTGDISNFLSSLLNILTNDKENNTITCSECGLTYDEFLESGILGCANCYKVFEKQLKPVLLRVHGRNQHAGKIPAKYEKEVKTAQRIQHLQSEMERNVKEENFEQAAILRDKIKLLLNEDKSEAINDNNR